MKYSGGEFEIDKDYATKLENKRDVFKLQTRTKKSIFITFVTIFGLVDNEYARRLVQNSITADALFE